MHRSPQGYNLGQASNPGLLARLTNIGKRVRYASKCNSLATMWESIYCNSPKGCMICVSVNISTILAPIVRLIWFWLRLSCEYHLDRLGYVTGRSSASISTIYLPENNASEERYKAHKNHSNADRLLCEAVHKCNNGHFALHGHGARPHLPC